MIKQTLVDLARINGMSPEEFENEIIQTAQAVLAMKLNRVGESALLIRSEQMGVKYKLIFGEDDSSGRISFVNSETQKPVNVNNKGSVLFIWRANAPKNSHTVTLIDRDDLMGIK